MPTDELKNVDKIVKENIIPYNKAYCTYILKTAQVSMVVITEGHNSRLSEYAVEIRKDGVWKQVDSQPLSSSVRSRVHISRFSPIEANAVRVRFKAQENILSIAEIGVY